MSVLSFNKEKSNMLFYENILPLMQKNFYIYDFFKNDNEAIFIIKKKNKHIVYLKYYQQGTITDKLTVEESAKESKIIPHHRVSNGQWYIEKIKPDILNKYERLRDKLKKNHKKLDENYIIEELKYYMK